MGNNIPNTGKLKPQYQNAEFCEQLLKFAHPFGKRILDIGCGNGELVKFIADCYAPWEIIGIEPALEEWWNTCESAGDNWKVQSGNALNIDFPDNSFDLVISVATFEHISDPAKALSEIKRVLKPYGKFYTTFSPVWTSIIGHHYSVPTKECYWNEATLLTIPPWGHLYMSENEMANHFHRQQIATEMIDNALGFIYHSDIINRLSRTSILSAVMNCGMIVRYYKELVAFNRVDAAFGVPPPPATPGNPELTPEIVEQALRNGYKQNDLSVAGMSLCLEKYAAC